MLNVENKIVEENLSNEKLVLKNRQTSSLYENSKIYDALEVDLAASNRLKISPFNEKRWEVPFEFGPMRSQEEIEIKRIDLESGSVAFKVIDKKSGVEIFDTQVGPIVFEEMFMQVSFFWIMVNCIECFLYGSLSSFEKSV